MSIIGSGHALLLASAAAEPVVAAEISRSLRFNAPDSAYLSRTPGSAGNQKTWTWAGWVKRNRLTAQEAFFSAALNTSNRTAALFDSSGRLRFFNLVSGGVAADLVTTQVFRDPSAWYHIQIVLDTSQATNTNRYKLYVNNTQVTVFSTATYPAQDSTPFINSNVAHSIGRETGYAGEYASLMLADVHFIDGQALDPTSFGFFDGNGIWQPKEYTDSFGTNGFHLPFSDNSTTAALGDDTSGNGNDWTVNNIIAAASGTVWSSYVTGTPYSSIYPAAYAFDGNADTGHMALAANGTAFVFTPPSAIPISSSLRIWGNRVSTGGVLSINGTDVTSQMALNSYQWNTITGFSSITSISWSTVNGNNCILIAAIEVDGTILVDGVAAKDVDSLRDSPTNGDTANDTGLGGEVPGNYCTLNPLDSTATLTNGNLDMASGSWVHGLGTIHITSGKWYFEALLTSFSGAGALMGFTKQGNVNVDAFRIIYEEDGRVNRDGTGIGNTTGLTTYGAGDLIGASIDMDAGEIKFYKNGTLINTTTNAVIGSTAWRVMVKGDGAAWSANFGQRPFAYQAPSNFRPLATPFLPTPTIEDGSAYMDVVTYTGNGGTQTISGLGFSPDFAWFKARDQAYSHSLYDVIRGALIRLKTNSTDQEASDSGSLTAFNSDGFTLGGSTSTNANTEPYVAWTWDAGTYTISNTDGSITSSVRANASAGFAVITGSTPSSNVNFTFGHNLGAAPSLVIYKHTAVSGNWQVYHRSGGGNNYNLNSTAGPANSGTWSGLDPTSTLITIPSTIVSANSSAFVCYAFAPVAGYSAFGSYTGNGSQTDGTFIYTGFRPRFFLTKASSTTSDWYIWDSARDSYNASISRLFPNLSNAESVDAANDIDFVSNGIKMRTGTANQSNVTYIYAAFAEHPFSIARAR